MAPFLTPQVAALSDRQGREGGCVPGERRLGAQGLAPRLPALTQLQHFRCVVLGKSLHHSASLPSPSFRTVTEQNFPLLGRLNEPRKTLPSQAWTCHLLSRHSRWINFPEAQGLRDLTGIYLDHSRGPHGVCDKGWSLWHALGGGWPAGEGMPALFPAGWL